MSDDVSIGHEAALSWKVYPVSARDKEPLLHFIREALANANGNISEAARMLGLTRRGLYLKLRRLGLDARSEEEIVY